MTKQLYSIITGTGSYVPHRRVPNSAFLSRDFFDKDGLKFEKSNEEIVGKLEEITGIAERRYADDNLVTSDLAFYAAEEALATSGYDRENLDYLIVAHNFGDVKSENKRSEFVPSLAARVKHHLRISNPKTIAYDLPFGCPGWLQAMIQANYFLKSGDAKSALVIGAETLSRISDPHDRDSMIYADGAGATILEARESEQPIGILSHATRSDTFEHAYMLWMDTTYNPDRKNGDLFLKMNGHRLYTYAISTVPLVAKESLDKAGLDLGDVSKVLIHQANAKMDDAILKRLFKLYGRDDIPENIMPMTISKLGNTSVATLPTLLDKLYKNGLNGHQTASGDIIVFASVGAGMNINSIVYKTP